jgi:hypothetical protein
MTDYRSTREALNLLRSSNRIGSHDGCFRASPGGESDAHIRRKFEVWLALRSRGRSVMTEAIFTNGARADVVDLDQRIVWEVLHSETQEECAAKIKAYPPQFQVRTTRTRDEWRPTNVD